ncbi:MAG: hypothetical protein ACR2LX_00020 [Jatrophihabitans sp.]
MTEVKGRLLDQIPEAGTDRLGAVDAQLVEQLADRARSHGLQLTSEGRLLGYWHRLTKPFPRPSAADGTG